MSLCPDSFCMPPILTWESFCGRHPNGFYVSVLCPHNIGWHSPQSEKTQRRDPHQGFPGGSEGKVSACNAGDLSSIPGSGRSPWRRKWQPTPVLLPGKSHGWRTLVGCSPWGREESDTTEQLHFDFLLSCIGEGNGNPLQCSCLENPRDGGAWWAAIYGVSQSWTRLK